MRPITTLLYKFLIGLALALSVLPSASLAEAGNISRTAAPTIEKPTSAEFKQAEESQEAEEISEFSPVPNVPHQIAVLQGLDKANARVETFSVPVGELANFGTLSIFIRTCRKTPPEENPESAIFIEIHDQPAAKSAGIPPANVFQGWMFASSPALSALDHATYDVWLLDCKNPVKADN